MNSNTARLGTGRRLESGTVDELAFESREERLTHGVVVGVSRLAHRRPHASLSAAFPQSNRRVLALAIGRVNDPDGPPVKDLGNKLVGAIIIADLRFEWAAFKRKISKI